MIYKLLDIKRLVEPHFYNDLDKGSYKIKRLKAKKLLTSTRFDLGFKLFYLDMKDKNHDLAKEVYHEHIKAFSLGKLTEPGNEEKKGKDKFIEEFDKTFESIKDSGFDKNKTLIPLSKNNSIANGAHRLASAIFLNEDIDCVKLNTNNHVYDYNFFHQRGVDKNTLDTVATKFIQYANNVHIAFMWPVGIQKNKDIYNIIPNIVYKKTIKLSANGAHNLLSQIYYKEEWLGTVGNNFEGVYTKLIACFKTFDSFDVIAFQSDSLYDVLKLKDKLRKIFNIGKHSVHITDTKDEAVRVARIVFNDNSLHFLNFAKPNKYISTYTMINIFKKFISKNNISLDDVILVNNIALSAYGLRKSNDIDYFTLDNNKLEYYDEEKINLLYNPKFYFYFNDVKFISFNQLYKMKKNRNKDKDKNDCKIMEALIEKNHLKEFNAKMRQQILYGKIKFKVFLIRLLQNFGIYETIRKVIKGKR